MDFNIYDILGNPPSPKNNVRWCPFCGDSMPYNKDWDMCEICGKSKDENNQELSLKGESDDKR